MAAVNPETESGGAGAGTEAGALVALPFGLLVLLGSFLLFQVELIMALEDEFALKIPEEDAEKLLTVGSAVDYVLKKAE